MFDQAKADAAVDFIQSLKHSKGEWAGQSISLDSWQREPIEKIFGNVDENGNRIIRTAYWEVPSKCGKSTVASAISLYLLCSDDEMGAEIYSAASDREQAGIIFMEAVSMVEQDAQLRDLCTINISKKRISYWPTKSFYQVLTADARRNEGWNAHGVIFDEFHTQPNRKLYDVLRKRVAARRQPLFFIITTAGFDRQSVCWDVHCYAEKIIKGEEVNPAFQALIFAAKDSEDWKDEEVWKRVSPGLGRVKKLDFMRNEMTEALNNPALQNSFRRYHLNIWTTETEKAIDLDLWAKISGVVDPVELRGRACVGGLDLASHEDMNALVLMFPSEDGSVQLLPFFWVPEALVKRSRSRKVDLTPWVRAGLINVTPGNIADLRSDGVIYRDILDLAEFYEIQSIGYDRLGSDALCPQLMEDGIKMVPVGQGYASMNAPTKKFLALIAGGKLYHGNNPVLKWQAENLVIATDPAGNWKPDKKRSADKIDGLVAAIMSIGQWMLNPVEDSLIPQQAEEWARKQGIIPPEIAVGVIDPRGMAECAKAWQEKLNGKSQT